MLRGENIELVARDIDATAADVSGWRDVFLETGASGLKHRPRDVRDEEIGSAARQGGRGHHGQRASRREDREDGGGPPFRAPEVEAMSAVLSISTGKAYGVSRVCRAWGPSRASVYRDLQPAQAEPSPRRRPDPDHVRAKFRW